MFVPQLSYPSGPPPGCWLVTRTRPVSKELVLRISLGREGASPTNQTRMVIHPTMTPTLAVGIGNPAVAAQGVADRTVAADVVPLLPLLRHHRRPLEVAVLLPTRTATRPTRCSPP